eukprot:scaffold1654_cov45-Attheya_sp.AAC.2
MYYVPYADPPSLEEPQAWFDHYDKDHSHSLDQEEVVTGLWHTLQSNGASGETKESVRAMVQAVWGVFDTDGNGVIDKREFCISPGGMSESLLLSLQNNHHQNNHNNTTPRAAYVPQVFIPPGPSPHTAPTAPAETSEFWTCSRCTFINTARDSQCNACHSPAPPGIVAVVAPPPPSVQAYAPTYSAPPSVQPYYATAQPILVSSPQQQEEIETLRVLIPPGMKAGQQIQAQSPSTGPVVVTIPPKHKWQTNKRLYKKQSYFDVDVPTTKRKTTTTTQPAFVAPPPARPTNNNVVIQGTYVASGGGASYARPTSTTANGGNVYASTPFANHDNSHGRMSQGRQEAWQSWERFVSHSYRPVPVGMHSAPVAKSAMASVPASGRRRALLIGINYKGTRAALRGCVNDAKQMKHLLIQHGFPNDSSHMVVLTDEDKRNRPYLPTRANILKALQWLVQGVSEGDVLFFHFSGHGAQVPDKTGHEADGYNETILPLDYQSGGQIADDILWGSLVFPLPSGVRLTALMDCCHSGTGLDLPHECNIRPRAGQPQWKDDINPAHSAGDVLLFSGCEDSQTSADAYDQYQAGGAMTQSFIKAYQENSRATYPAFMASIHRHLQRRGFKQRPQLTTSQTFDVRSRIFSFVDGIEPNRNPQIGRMKKRHIRAGRANGGNSGLNDILFGVGTVAVGMAFLDMLF